MLNVNSRLGPTSFLTFCALLMSASSGIAQAKIQDEPDFWQKIDQGIFLATPKIPSAFHPEIDPTIVILSVNPVYFNFEFYSASESKKGSPKTASTWANQKGLNIAVNAGMDEPDYRPTGYARKGSKVFSPTPARNYSTRLLMGNSSFDIQNSACTNANTGNRAMPGNAHTELGIGSLQDCDGLPVEWKKAKSLRASMVVMGKLQTDTGEVLIAFSRAPRTMIEFQQNLQELGFVFSNLVYLEGGPEASLSIRTQNLNRQWNGSFETGFVENDKTSEQFRIPNIIGIRKLSHP